LRCGSGYAKIMWVDAEKNIAAGVARSCVIFRGARAGSDSHVHHIEISQTSRNEIDVFKPISIYLSGIFKTLTYNKLGIRAGCR
jgi:hypothetical protein